MGEGIDRKGVSARWTSSTRSPTWASPKASGRAIALVRPIDRVTIWNRTPGRAEALAEVVTRGLPGAGVRVAADPSSAVSGADIVCCATAATEPLFEADALPPGAHVNAVGSYRPDMHELPGELLSRAGIVAVDDADACAVEAGEIVDALTAGRLKRGDLRELSELIAAPPLCRGITVFKSVGVALADLALASELLNGSPVPSSRVEGGHASAS